MTATDEGASGADAPAAPGSPSPAPRPPWVRNGLRYAPIVVIALVIGAVVALRGGGGDDDQEESSSDAAAATGDELIESGPMTPQKAELEGKTDVDFGPNCDTETGRITLPVIVAPPCVEPFTGDNGGATTPGVTDDEILVVYYETNPDIDPLGAASISSLGVDVDPDGSIEALQGYADLYNELFETYGRTVRFERFLGTGQASDVEAAKADAIAIGERHPFAVLGGPANATQVFGPEIASQGIMCGPGCSGPAPDEIIARYSPLMWTDAPTPDQAAALTAEMVGKLAGPGKAELAGDPELAAQDRRYAVVHYDTADGTQAVVFDQLVDDLAEVGIELTTDVVYQYDQNRTQENARTIIAKLQSAGVTTVIFSGDPFTPDTLTAEATNQDYHPEWILGPNAFADTTLFAREYDGEQWRHGFGLALTPVRGPIEDADAVVIYDWAYGTLPPANTAPVIEGAMRSTFTGIHLAGPELTPQAFQDGLHRLPVLGGGPTVPQYSVGPHDVWPGTDWGGGDDFALVWWDPQASGPDEIGRAGVGMYRYALGGQRYTTGQIPSSPERAGLFDDARSTTIYDQLPESDRPPDYPPPS
jgi:hypothetical protein